MLPRSEHSVRAILVWRASRRLIWRRFGIMRLRATCRWRNANRYSLTGGQWSSAHAQFDDRPIRPAAIRHLTGGQDEWRHLLMTSSPGTDWPAAEVPARVGGPARRDLEATARCPPNSTASLPMMRRLERCGNWC